MEVADNAKDRVSVRERRDRVAVAVVAESQTTTEGNNREAMTLVRKVTNAPATLEAKARVLLQPAIAAAVAITRRRKRAGARFLNVPANWNN